MPNNEIEPLIHSAINTIEAVADHFTNTIIFKSMMMVVLFVITMFTIMVVLFVGTPDIHDAIIFNLKESKTNARQLDRRENPRVVRFQK